MDPFSAYLDAVAATIITASHMITLVCVCAYFPARYGISKKKYALNLEVGECTASTLLSRTMPIMRAIRGVESIWASMFLERQVNWSNS